MGARLVIIGIDGGTFDLAAPWAREGVLPNIARLMERGAWGDMITTYPPITAAAWSSMLTGCNPGKHGVYDFLVRDPSTEDVVDSRSIRQPTLWQMLSAAGRRVASINVPVTYPPTPVNGAMISGPLSPRDPDKSALPMGLIQDLEARTGRRWWQYDRSEYAPSRPGELLEVMARCNTTMAAFACELLAREQFDALMVVFNVVDVVSHFFWHYMDRTHPFHDGSDPGLTSAVQNAYSCVDGLIGQVLQAAGPDSDVMLVSDHGFGPQTRTVNLNNFLAAHGYLVFRRSAGAVLKRALRRVGFTPARVMAGLERVGLDWIVFRVSRSLRNRVVGAMGSYADIDWARTICYSRGHIGQLYFTPEVRADPARFAAMREEVAAALRDDLRDPSSGEPVVSELLFGEDIYWGDLAAEGPDIFLVMDDWRTISYPLLAGGPELFAPHVQRNRYGNHRMNGMFCASGPSFQRAGHLEPVSILDVAPTVLCVQHLAPPEHIDGRVLEEAVSGQSLAALPERSAVAGPVERDGPQPAIPDEEEQRQRRQRLRDLGYL
jgi:predicted AlkP superfamily phosphohydrolase/phosphomutase